MEFIANIVSNLNNVVVLIMCCYAMYTNVCPYDDSRYAWFTNDVCFMWPDNERGALAVTWISAYSIYDLIY